MDEGWRKVWIACVVCSVDLTSRNQFSLIDDRFRVKLNVMLNYQAVQGLSGLGSRGILNGIDQDRERESKRERKSVCVCVCV